MVTLASPFTRPTFGRRYSLSQRLEGTALCGVLLLSAGLNIWNLGINGWANAYYSAAIQAGLHSREAFLFGSMDWGNGISVDKPPLSLWVIGLSVRLLGFNSWAILIPQAALGIASTFLIYRIARRLSVISGLVAALIFSTTPVVVLMSRYNNPDALMTFLMVASLAASLKMMDSGSLRWVALSGVLLGLAVLTKQLQALFVAPSIAVIILSMLTRRRPHAFRAVVVFATPFVLVSASWFVILSLIPAYQRPFLGSTTSNNPLELTFGFNGIERFTGTPNPSAALMPSSASQSDAGPLRLLGPNVVQEAGWLLATAFIALLMLLAAGRCWGRRGDKAYLTAICMWFLVVYSALSFMGSGFHTYYSLSLAPPLALVLGAAAHGYADQRARRFVRWIAATGLLVATLSVCLILSTLAQPPDALRTVILTMGAVSAAITGIGPLNRIVQGVAAIAACAVLIGPLFADVGTLSRAVTGALPSSGMPTSSPYSLSRLRQAVDSGELPEGVGYLAYGRTLPADVSTLISHAPLSCVWAAATIPAQSAANLQLATDRPVMPLGGYQAIDPWPTESEFRDWVKQGKVCYLVDQPGLDPVATDKTEAGRIIRWIRSNFRPTTVDGTLLYDLRHPRS